jgi:protein SCO1/2
LGEFVNRRPLVRVFQVTTGLLLGLAVALWFFRPGPVGEGEDPAGYFLPDPLPAPDFTLLSHTGDVVSSSDFPEKTLAVFFGYTSCPDVCPLTLGHLSRAFRLLGETSERVQVLFITVDPARDTPGRMGVYLGSFHPSFLGLTGTEEEIRRVSDAFGAFFMKAGEGLDYTVDHTARTFIVDPFGRIPLTFPVTATPEEIARDLTLLLEDE